MPKRFCVTTKGLSPEQSMEFANDLNDLVKKKMEKFDAEKVHVKEDSTEKVNTEK